MTDFTKVPLPRTPSGTVTWESLAPYLGTVLREILARSDMRNPQSDFASAVIANSDGTVTIGVQSSVTDQRTLPIVNTGNKLSAQNANPLSSTGSATTASIQIAAHNVRYGFGSVPYNGGTISGLTPSTLYYVYASDPDYTGGAVTYAATTDPQTVVGSGGNYYVGAINAAISSPTGTITAATSANPIEFTSAAHGLSSGQSVVLSALPGDFGTNLNGNQYTVTVTSSSAFTIAVDGSLYAAYTTGGSFTRVSTPTSGGSSGAGWDINYVVP